jgi:hypothetical protein
MHIKAFRLPSMNKNVHYVRVRWHTLNPATRTAMAAVTIFGIVLAVFTVFNAISPINATAASVLVAVVFGIVTIFQQHQSQRREHTVNLLTGFLATGHVAAGLAWIADRQLLNEPIAEQPSMEDRHHISVALDYYELISALAIRGQIDVRMVRDLLGSSMIRDFDACRPYIDYRRGLNAPKIYSDTELFLAEYCRLDRQISRLGRINSSARLPPC